MAFSHAGDQLLILIIVFDIVVTIVLGLRLWAIRVNRRSLSLDDYFVCVAYVGVRPLCNLFYLDLSLMRSIRSASSRCRYWISGPFPMVWVLIPIRSPKRTSSSCTRYAALAPTDRTSGDD